MDLDAITAALTAAGLLEVSAEISEAYVTVRATAPDGVGVTVRGDDALPAGLFIDRMLWLAIGKRSS
jgi:hypothetical protein